MDRHNIAPKVVLHQRIGLLNKPSLIRQNSRVKNVNRLISADFCIVAPYGVDGMLGTAVGHPLNCSLSRFGDSCSKLGSTRVMRLRAVNTGKDCGEAGIALSGRLGICTTIVDKILNIGLITYIFSSSISCFLA